MPFHPIETNSFDIGYTLLSAFVVVFGLLSLFSKEKLYIGEAVWSTAFGIIIGPYCADVFNPREWGAKSDINSDSITIQVTRIVLAVGVFAIGVELPNAYVGRHWKSLAFLLIPVMVFGWFVSSALIYAFIPRLDYLSSLAVAACLTPTDPILAAAVVGGRYAEKHVPAHLRHLLAAESGVNDGAAFPMLFISLYLILDKSDATAVGHWFYITWAYEIILGTVLGSILGFSARHIMKFCERHDLIDRHSYVAQYISLALLSNGITSILGSDDLLASFACGTAFAYDGWFNKKTEETLFSNVIDLIFNCACFIYIGAWIPFGDFNDHELSLSWWRLLIIALLVILLRRLPIMLALYKWIPEVKTFREAVFSGHFGPMGVGAVFIATLAIQNIPEFYPQVAGRPPETQLELLSVSMQPIVGFIVLVSIAIHGLSIPFFSLGKRVHSISRTWSRHTSLEPEWAIQARHVTSGDEIVINRDPENIEDVLQKMERGEMMTMPRTESPENVTPTSPISYDEEKKERLDEVRVAGVDVGKGQEPRLESVIAKGRATGGEDSGDSPIPEREQVAGDKTQWREGNDLIIERRVGPGEDVEVEVVKNCFNPDERNMSKVIQGAREHLEHDAKLANAGIHELAKHLPAMSSGTVDAKHDPQHIPGTFLSSSSSPSSVVPPKLRIVEGWGPHPKGNDGHELPAPDILKNDQELGDSPSKDDSQQSSDTEGADVEDNRGGGRGGSGSGGAGDGSPTTPLDAYDTPSPSEVPSPSGSRSRSQSSSRSRSPAPILRTSETAAIPAVQVPVGSRSNRRESFRRKLWGRSPFLREHGRHGDRNNSRSPTTVGARSPQSDAEESENDDDVPQRTSVDTVRPRPHGTSSDIHPHHPHHRSRSESPRRITASVRNGGGRRHQKHHLSERRFELSPPESRDEVDDDLRALSSAPSPNVLHQRLDTLAAAAAVAASEQPPSATGSGSGESRQNSLGSPSTSTPGGGRSRVQTLAGTGATRSIRFAEELGFERNDSSSSLSRTGSGGGGGGGHKHQHLHYQHAHGARRSSPGPSGYTTPRSRIAPIGTPIGAVIGSGSGGGGGGSNTPHASAHGHTSEDDERHRHGHKRGASSQKPPLSELF